MKRLILAITLVFASLSSVTAQSKYNYEVWDVVVGGKLGVGTSTLTSVDADRQVFPYGSIYGELYVGNTTTMSLEVGYAHKGGNNVAGTAKPGAPEATIYDFNLNYINLSYIVKYLPTKNLGVYAGLSMGRMVDAKAKTEGESLNIIDDLKKGDFSFPLGVEYTIARNWTVDLRYHLSPSTIAKSEGAKSILGKAHNQLISLTVGYKIQVF